MIAAITMVVALPLLMGCASGQGPSPVADVGASDSTLIQALPNSPAVVPAPPKALGEPSAAHEVLVATPSVEPRPAQLVYVLGDSLTFKARKYLGDALERHGWGATVVDARNGRMAEEGLTILAQADDLPDTILVALGTNNWLASRAEAAGWIEETRAIIGPRRTLVWVNVQMDGERFRNYVNVNRGLVKGAKRDNRTLRATGEVGRTYVADWASFATDRRIRHNHDGVHYKAGGYRQRVDFYGAVLTRSPNVLEYLGTN